MKKNLKKSYKIIIGIIIVIIISGTTAYAVTVIDSQSVSYKDNSNLGADNVQAAIDNTVSRIDQKLYSYKVISECKIASTTASLAYTGLYFQASANSIVSVTAIAMFNNSPVQEIAISDSSTSAGIANLYAATEVPSAVSALSTTLNFKVDTAKTFYVWAKYETAKSNQVCIRGYIGTTE